MANLKKSIFPLRLNKYISYSGICSRRKADELIKSGKISVNNNIIKDLSFLVNQNDRVCYLKKQISLKENIELKYIILNKPKNYIVTLKDELNRKTVFELFNSPIHQIRFFPIGRLDRQSTGVLLFTNDGMLANKLTHPSSNIIKTYIVTLDKNLKKNDHDLLLSGINLSDGETHFDKIEFVDSLLKNKFYVSIHSGKNRIIRRMFEHLNYSVKSLDRVSFAGITHKNLKRGEWRFLTRNELYHLKNL